MTALAASASNAGSYLHWGVISISVTNALIVLGMIVLFALALVLPFPKPPREPGDDGSES
jgi:hypothetical protein